MNTRCRALAMAVAAWLAACTEQAATLPQPGEEPFQAESPGPVRLALVLSSGGLRGLAHVGVLQALEAEGIRPDLVVGSSVGALVGAIHASGHSAAEIRQVVEADSFALGAGWPWPGLDRQSVYGFVAGHLQRQRVERFPIAFAAVATDLQSGCLAFFNAGGGALAVQASTGLPGVFEATPIDGHRYADGGLTSPVPVRVARRLGAEKVIAVDVTFPPRESSLEGLMDRLFQIGLVLTRALATQEADEADLVIRPELPEANLIHLGNRAALMTAGEQAVRAALPALRRLLAAPVPPRGETVPDSRQCPQLKLARRQRRRRVPARRAAGSGRSPAPCGG